MRTGSRRERRAGSWQTPTNRPPPMSCLCPGLSSVSRIPWSPRWSARSKDGPLRTVCVGVGNNPAHQRVS